MGYALRNEIEAILEKGRDLTLATIRPDGAPQATTVSYVNDGLAIYFGCSPASQKACNLAGDDRISLTVDLPYETWREIRGLSIFGRARPVVVPTDMETIGRLFRRKFPELGDWGASPHDLALYCVTPQIVSVLDYARGFGHTDTATAAELGPASSSLPGDSSSQNGSDGALGG